MTHDETFRPLRVGEGRISGYLSSLGVLSVLGVLCFLFPDFLTTPQLRGRLHRRPMRELLGAGMVFSAAFGLLTFVLNRQKIAGRHRHLRSPSLAMWRRRRRRAGRAALRRAGLYRLDWFILDLLMSAMSSSSSKSSFPHIREQAILRPDWWHDLRYFVAQPPADRRLCVRRDDVCADASSPGRSTTTCRLFRVVIAWDRAVRHGDRLADLVEYAIHRTMHEVKVLWPIHAVHHSVEHMDWLAGSRLHFLEPLVTRALVLIPAFILGIAKEPLTVYIIFAGFQAGLIHANIRLGFRAAQIRLRSPRYHHWHHSSDDEAIDTNYAAHLPAIDWMFGTYHMPPNRWPREIRHGRRSPAEGHRPAVLLPVPAQAAVSPAE